MIAVDMGYQVSLPHVEWYDMLVDELFMPYTAKVCRLGNAVASLLCSHITLQEETYGWLMFQLQRQAFTWLQVPL